MEGTASGDLAKVAGTESGEVAGADALLAGVPIREEIELM